MTFTTTFKTEILSSESFILPDPVKAQNPVTKSYLEATVGTSIQDQLDDILEAVDVILIGDLQSESTSTIPPVIMAEGNYTRVFVDQFGEVRSGTNITFTSGEVQGTLSGATVSLNLTPSGVIPGTYGNSTSIPLITVSPTGRILSVSTTTVSVDNSFNLVGDTGSSEFILGNTLGIRGTANQIVTSAFTDTAYVALANNITIPGIFSAGAITANTISATGGFNGSLQGNVVGNVVGNLTGSIIGNIQSTVGTFTTLISTGLNEVGGIGEIINTKTGAFGSVVHDFSTGAIWYHSGATANFTVALINTPATSNRAIGITLLLQQGSNPFIATALTINGSTTTMRWLSGTVPTGTANKLDMQSFTFMRISNSWIVTGSLVSFG